MALTLAEANRIVAGAISEAERLGIKISAAVVDSGGRSRRLQSNGRRNLGRRIRLPGQGCCLGGLWPAQCASSSSAMTPASPFVVSPQPKAT